MNPSETATVLGKLKGAWPRQPITAETVEVYTQALEPFPFDHVAHAITKLIRTATFFPTVAEILNTAAQAMLDAPGPSEAWAIVVGEVRRVGLYGRPDFRHEVIRDAVQAVGGFRRLCESRDATADRAKFHTAYSEILAEHVEQYACGDLPALPPQATKGQLTE